MKTLNRIQINPDKLMIDDDLISIKGGYDGSCCMCYVLNGVLCLGAMAAASSDDCHDLCESLIPGISYGVWNC